MPRSALTGSSTNLTDSGTYTVTVNTGSGDNTLGLSRVNATGIRLGVSNAPFAGTLAYAIEKTAPTVLSSAYRTATTTQQVRLAKN